MSSIRKIGRRHVLAAGLGLALGPAAFATGALADDEAAAKAMVAKAIALYDEKGEAALAVFNEGKAAGFEEGDVYIVVESRGADGKVLCTCG